MFDISTYNPYLKTSIVRKKMSSPMKNLQEMKLLHGTILDVGCGYGEDVNILRDEYNIDVNGFDLYNSKFNWPELLERSYDCITCIYVFNVIPSFEEHSNLLLSLKKLSNNIYIAVRSDFKSIRPNWEYVDEYQGYITTTDSFQRFYTKETIRELFGEVIFLKSSGSYYLFQVKIQ